MMLDGLRVALYRAITTPTGDGLAPIRVQKEMARRLNALLGRPLCDGDELARRRAALARLELARREASRGGADAGAAATAKSAREPSPILVYFEKNRNARELARITELLDAKKLGYRLLDVADDEATLTFVMHAAQCEADDLPIVFVANQVIGPFPKLVEADVSGALAAAVYGEGSPAAGAAASAADDAGAASQSPMPSQ